MMSYSSDNRQMGAANRQILRVDAAGRNRQAIVRFWAGFVRLVPTGQSGGDMIIIIADMLSIMMILLVVNRT